jgi:hypothetical protein
MVIGEDIQNAEDFELTKKKMKESAGNAKGFIK